MPVTSSDLQLRLSGGQFNTNPNNSLGGQVSDTSITSPAALFDFVHYNEAYFGDTEYRCFYIFNAHATDSIIDLALWTTQPTLTDNSPAPEEINIAIDPHGVGDGRTSGVAYSTPSEDLAPTIDVPTGLAAAASSGGSLVAGTYFYRVAALNESGQTEASEEVSSAVDGTTTTAVTISWTAVPGASAYRVYGRASLGQNIFFETTATSFTDSGASGTSGTPPPESTATIPFPTTPPVSEYSAIGHVNLGPGQAIAVWVRRTMPVGTQLSYTSRPSINLIFGA